MKQKKKKDEPPPPQPPSSCTIAEQQQQQQQQQQQLCNGGEPKPKKSALKRTATGGSKSSKSSGKNKRHVQFNESLNVFFESDYVIVIRDDDCDFDEEDFDFWSQQPCSCGDESCFQPWLDDDDGRRNMPPFEPYDDQPATLSPPDGYKDGCPRHVPPTLDQLKYADDDLTTRYNSEMMMDRCGDTHNAATALYNPITNSTSYFEDNNKKINPELSSQLQPNKNEQEQQQPSTTSTAVQLSSSKPNTVCDTNPSTTQQQSRCIMETITLTTVTERQIIQEPRTTVNVPSSGLNDVKTDDPKTTVAPDEGYVLIKCGNNTVLYNNRNPNSAVRQLFPTTKFVCPPTRIKETDDARLLNKYLITEESLRAFDSRSLNGAVGGFKSEAHSDDDDDDNTSNSLIRRTIERSTLRRNTSKKKNVNDPKEISLIEKIRRLTCDSDDDADDHTKKTVTSTQQEQATYTVLVQCESVVPSTSTATPAYKKLTDLFGGNGRYEQPLLPPDNQSSAIGTDSTYKPEALDLCDSHSATGNRATVVRSVAGGKPFLSTLATACVTGNVHTAAMVTTGATTQQPHPCPQPDVVAGTQGPSVNRQEELAAFVQQDSGRLEKIRKRYMPSASTSTSVADDGNVDNDDDENDDYGFNRRPEVHGIRSGFSAQITIKNNNSSQQPLPQRPRSYYGDLARQPTPVELQPDFVPRYPLGVGSAVAAVVRTSRTPPPYPVASQRSIIKVTHGQQQQTIRVPYQAVGPVQVHLLTTAAATATATANVGGYSASQVQIRHPTNEYIVQHGHTRIHHGQQFVIARGTQTAAISTTRYYQLPPPPPLNHLQQQQQQQQQQQLPQTQLPPQPFQASVDGNPSAHFGQTSPTRAVANSRHVVQPQQEFVDHNLPPPIPQAPKNPVLFYGMNV